MTPQQELELNIRRLRAVHDAAERVVREYLSERSTGSRVEDAVYRLKDALAVSNGERT